jgi:hypothetical protein
MTYTASTDLTHAIEIVSIHQTPSRAGR